MENRFSLLQIIILGAD